MYCLTFNKLSKIDKFQKFQMYVGNVNEKKELFTIFGGFVIKQYWGKIRNFIQKILKMNIRIKPEAFISVLMDKELEKNLERCCYIC